MEAHGKKAYKSLRETAWLTELLLVVAVIVVVAAVIVVGFVVVVVAVVIQRYSLTYG